MNSCCSVHAAARAAEDMQLQVEAPAEERPTKVVNSEVRARSRTSSGWMLITNFWRPSEAIAEDDIPMLLLKLPR